MKFRIQRNEIYEALQRVFSVIPPRSTITMTQNIFFRAEAGNLEMVTTDLEITMVANVSPLDIEQEGAIALPGRLVHDIVRELPDTLLTFETYDRYRLELQSEFGKYKIAGENPAEFPQRPQVETGNEIEISNQVLANLIDKSIFACSTDELRPALTGVYFEVEDHQVQTVATDGHRLALLKYRDDSLPESRLSAIISTRALNFVQRGLEGDGVTVLTLGNKHALFHTENIRIYARLIEEQYVDYLRVIPTEINYEMRIDSEAFLASVKRVSLFSNPITAQVVLKIDKSKIQIHAEDIDYGGEANEEIPCEFNGDEFTIGFNSRYLQDILRHASSPQLALQLIRADSAALVKPLEIPDNQEQLMLLMPIRLDND